MLTIFLAVPVINTMLGVYAILKLKKIRSEADKATLGMALFMTAGLGILLLPVLAIGTVARKIFNVEQEKEEDKIYLLVKKS